MYLLPTKKNIKVKPIDLTFSNNRIIYCDGLPVEILTPYVYLNIETMNIISCDFREEFLIEEDRDVYINSLKNNS